MPELPEAETIASDLRAQVVGSSVVDVRVPFVDVLAPSHTATAFRERIRRCRIREVGRRGKNVVLRLDPDQVMVVNLGMTGRLVVSDSPAAGQLRHIAVRFELEGGRALLYDDVRRFGRIELFSTEQWAERQTELGLEPLSDAFDGAALYARTQRSRSPIRNWLLDQRQVAGIGNIYANEALFRARIHPARPASSLGIRSVRRLRDALVDVLREAVESRGTTLNDYRDGNGEPGNFEPRLRVYGRESGPCPRCARQIRRLVLSNRSAFFCPHCQRNRVRT